MSTHADTSSMATTSPKAIARLPWRVYALFALVGLGMIAVVGFGFYKGMRITNTHIPFEHSAMNLMVEVTAAHLWLEEYLSGDLDENIDVVWRRLDHAERCTKAFLAGVQHEQISFDPPRLAQTRRNLEAFQASLADFRRIATERVAASAESGAGSAADRRIDATYAQLMDYAYAIEADNNREIEANRIAFRSTQAALVVACVVLTLVAGLVFRGFDRRRVAALATIRSTTESLETEVAERQHVERSLLRTQYAIDHASEPIYWVKSDARVSYANEAACKALGYTHDELTLLHVPDFDPDFTWDRWPVHWQDMKKAGSMTFESRYQKKDGSVFPVEVTSNHVDSTHEEYIWAYVRDVSEHKRSEEALRVSEERFRGISSAASDAIVLMDDRGMISFWNPAAEKMFGYSSEEALGASLHDLIVPQRYREAFAKSFPVFLETGEGPVLGRINEMTVMRRVGPDFPAEIAISRVRLWGRWHAAGIVRDVSDRRRAEQERARLVMAIEQAAEMILITDEQGAIQYANPAFERITGFPLDEILGKTPRILKSGKHDTRFYKEMWDKISHGEVWSGQMVNKRKDGSLYKEVGTISPMFDDSGSIINYVAVRRDMTREVELETQLHQAKKMEAIGLFASGVAHDFGNLLAAINGYTSLARSGLPADHKVAELLAGIQRAADQGESVTQSLLTFNCKAPTVKRSVDMHDQLEHVRQLLERVLPKNITVAPGSKDQTHLWVSADDSQIQRVIMNLALNARDAMPDGGTLTLSVSRGAGSDDGPNPDVPVARLVVGDTGVGMTPEVRERIFDPFFTTKSKGHGTGLGLAIIHGIVKEHGGQVTVSSESGRGSTFCVELPLIAEDIAPRELDRQALEPSGAGPLVVLADKNPQSRGVLGALLESQGHCVVQVGDGIGLADCADLNGARIVLYVLDNDLPRMSGFEFLGRLRAQGDSTPAILLMRTAATDIERQVDDRTSLVTKPYEVADLTRLVRTHLEPSAEPRA